MLLRIVSLLPSVTEILGHLRLPPGIIVSGVTHECDMFPDRRGMRHLMAFGNTVRVTTSDIDPSIHEQRKIDSMVKASLASQLSLYQIDEDKLKKISPDIIFTQSLCAVCAPDIAQVTDACKRLISGKDCCIVNLEPETLDEVAATFETIANACGVPESGKELSLKFKQDLSRISDVARLSKKAPKVLLLEWLDPPFDGGHWVPDQIRAAGCVPAFDNPGGKSKQRTWEEILEVDPDVVIVACCGFDLERNLLDLTKAVDSQSDIKRLRAFREGRIYVADGNVFFARPSPSLVGGAAIVLRSAYDGEDNVISQLSKTALVPSEGKSWLRYQNQISDASQPLPSPDIEDFWQVHDEACARNQSTYVDPRTGFAVFTKVGHLARGKCCGCGCRHCPFNHVNVKDKAAKIKQPAWIFKANLRQSVHVLFWSGGKDSFLALRSLLRKYPHDSLVLITTFDAESRIVAHQEIPIVIIEKQARHLNIPLVGIPLYSGIPYVDKVGQGIAVITESCYRVETLNFGDLHLEHIRSWRDSELSKFGIQLQYPLWKTPFEKLMVDLERSKAAVTISAVSKGDRQIKIGSTFNRQLMKNAKSIGWDEFGEQGEFHTLVRVWETDNKDLLISATESENI